MSSEMGTRVSGPSTPLRAARPESRRAAAQPAGRRRRRSAHARSRASRAAPRRRTAIATCARKRPPALSFLLRISTLRRAGARRCRCWRSTSPASRSRSSPRCCSRKRSTAASTRRTALHGTEQFLPFCLPADGAAVRALGPVRRARAAPGPDADRRLAVPGRVRRADLRARQRRTLLELLPLLWLAGVRDLLRVVVPRRVRPADRLLMLRAAGFQRRAVLVGRGQADRRRRARARGRAALADRGRRLPLADAAAGQRAALARHARRPRGGARHRRGSTR